MKDDDIILKYGTRLGDLQEYLRLNEHTKLEVTDIEWIYPYIYKLGLDNVMKTMPNTRYIRDVPIGTVFTIAGVMVLHTSKNSMIAVGCVQGTLDLFCINIKGFKSIGET